MRVLLLLFSGSSQQDVATPSRPQPTLHTSGPHCGEHHGHWEPATGRSGRWWFCTFGYTDRDQSQDLPGGAVGKNLPADAGDTGWLPRTMLNAEA